MNKINNLSSQALLVILDGFGHNQNKNSNAIIEANTPHLDHLFQNYPFTTINASGESVGLPKGVPGNSEVGHMNLGLGIPVRQDLVRINEAIDNKTFDSLPELVKLKNHALKHSKRIHLMGLLSDGGVHSHINHIKETVRALRSDDEEGLEVFLHAFMDGRDTKKDVGGNFIKEIMALDGVTLASIQGRSFGMDRDRRWNKIENSYQMFIGNGPIEEISPLDYLKREYQNDHYDEFISPMLFHKNYAMRDSDSVFFINFRPDRAIEISLTLTVPQFDHFDRPWMPSYFLCMTPYIPDEVELPILFDKEKMRGGLSEYLSEKGCKQFKIAETEKFAHITFFFNGGEKNPFSYEERVLIPSPRDVATYDLKPEMSAPLVTEKLLEALDKKEYKFFLVNFANPDMVGHTGNFQAAIKAIEVIDKAVGKLMNKCRENNIAMVVTADHGNSDQMVYPDGTPHTSHTNALVPFAVFHECLKNKTISPTSKQLALKDVAPTILNILNIEIPDNFQGKSIFS